MFFEATAVLMAELIKLVICLCLVFNAEGQSKDDRAVSPDFATFSRPGELANRRLFAVGVPFGLGSLLGSGCGGSKCSLTTQNQ
jgi:hypothetical protein